MPPRLIAHVTDAHLGQKLAFEAGPVADKMHYIHEPAQHRDHLRIVFDDIAKRGIPEVVFGGDIGAVESNAWFFELASRYPFRLRVVLGNHDSFAEVGRFAHGNAIGERREMFDAHEHAGVTYVVLDTSANAISERQFAWLSETLKTSKRTIVFVHHPVLAVDTPLDHSGAALRNREQLLTVLHSAGHEVAIFCGHYHMHDDATLGNARQWLTPAVSYQISKTAKTVTIDAARFGYRLIEIDDDEVRTDITWFDKHDR